MKNTLFKKGLVAGMIILFVGVSILSSVSSKNVSISYDKVVYDNNEIEPLDEYTEIVSFINGGGYIDWDDGCSGFIQHDFYVFSADIFIKAFTKNPLKPFYTATANEIHMDLYIGGIGCGPASPGELKCYLIGVAIGDIEWS